MHEIERRFLCGPLEGGALARADRVQRIRQGYLTTSGPAVRVRQKDDAFLMTVKAGGGLVRREVEWPIPADVADELFEIAGARVLSKTRHVLGRWEVDVFDGALAGLVVAEVELSAADESLPSPPAGVPLLREVTEEPGLTNQWLAALEPEAARAFVAAAAAGPDAALAWVRTRRARASGDPAE
ncbi:MAG: CYTH domain-containing protein [Gemmatimonadota bacterium]|nr:CYTH domain-containing protein [Gemmatimonadota bacterium]